MGKIWLIQLHKNGVTVWVPPFQTPLLFSTTASVWFPWWHLSDLWCCHLTGLLVCFLLTSSPRTRTIIIEQLDDLSKATQLGEDWDAIWTHVSLIPMAPHPEPCPESELQEGYYFLRITPLLLHVFMVDKESLGVLENSLSPKLPPLFCQVFCPNAEAETCSGRDKGEGPFLRLFPFLHPPAQPSGGELGTVHRPFFL